jgi:hypothetical protein
LPVRIVHIYNWILRVFIFFLSFRSIIHVNRQSVDRPSIPNSFRILLVIIHLISFHNFGHLERHAFSLFPQHLLSKSDCFRNIVFYTE